MDEVERFLKAADKVLSMKISDFLEKFKELMPAIDFIEEEQDIGELLDMIRRGKRYIIVRDKRGRPRGIVTYADLLMVFGRPKAAAAFLPFASIATSLSKVHVPSETLPKVRVARVMERLPQHVRLDEKVEEAATIMRMNNLHHVAVIDKKSKVHGVITADAILKAIMKEAGLS